MAFFTAVAIAGAVVSAVGTIRGMQAQKKQAQAQMDQQRLERRRSSVENIRAAQIARAQAMASAQGAGAAGGSGVAGGVESIGARLGSALGYASQQSALSNIVTKQGLAASRASGLASIGGSMFQFGAKFGGLDFLKGNKAAAGPADLTRSVA